MAISAQNVMKALHRAMVRSDADALLELYAGNARIQIINRDQPPSRPRELRGKAAISPHYRDVCGRAMKHRMTDEVAGKDRIAFTEQCEYPDGTQVVCSAMV